MNEKVILGNCFENLTKIEKAKLLKKIKKLRTIYKKNNTDKIKN